MAFQWFSDLFNKRAAELQIFEKVVAKTWGESKVVLYNAKSDKVIDIRETLKLYGASEQFLRGALTDAGITVSDDLDTKVEKIRDYVNKRLKYSFDQANYLKPEFWADAYTVWSKKTDDCDGYAILIMKLMELAGIPAWRRRVVAGKVATGEGHAYVVYFTQKNNIWCVVEGSYYASEAKLLFNTKPYTDNYRYVNVWFAFNEEKAWSKDKYAFANDFSKE